METIDVQDLLDLLPIVAERGAPWRIVDAKCSWKTSLIRNSLNECPACAIMNEITGSNEYSYDPWLCMLDMGLEIRGVSRLVVAADNDTFAFDSQAAAIRKQLISVLKPQENQA